MRNTLKQYGWAFGIALAVLIIIGGLATFASNPHSLVPSFGQTKTFTVSLSIDGLYRNETFEIAQGDTVLSMLEKLNTRDPSLRLEEKTYSGLGTLVDALGSKKNGENDKYWQYKVNGVMPQVGASSYVLKGGDHIEWSFTASQE